MRQYQFMPGDEEVRQITPEEQEAVWQIAGEILDTYLEAFEELAK